MLNEVLVLTVPNELPVYGSFVEQIKINAISAARELEPVNDAESQVKAVEVVRVMKQIVSGVERAREKVKKPFLDKGREVDADAKNYCVEIYAEIERVSLEISQYQIAENRRIEAENRRIEAEKEKAQKDADAALAKQEKLETKKNVSVTQAATAEVQTQTALQNLQKVSSQVAAPVAAAAGLKAKKVVKWKVTDAHALYLARPEFYELTPRQSVMKIAITKDTKLAGLEVWEELETKIR